MHGNVQVCSAQRQESQRETDGFHNGEVSINDLPEDLIIRILSCLHTNVAVRTSVLSKDWEYKWALVNSIIIDDTPCGSRRDATRSLLEFVDRILLHSQNIQSFHLSCFQIDKSGLLKSWISSLSRRNITSIVIKFPCYYIKYDFSLPSCLFDSPSLTTLRLELPCIFRVPVKTYFCKLKSLYLRWVQFESEHFSNEYQLILTFPVLESLNLRRCDWAQLKLVEIDSPALTNFRYSSDKSRINNFLIKICGAKLEQFRTSGVSLNHFDLSTSSIVRATIKHRSRYGHPLVVRESGSTSGLSNKGFSGFRDLRLRYWILKAYAQFKPGRLLPKFHRLEKLQLDVVGSIETLLELLQMAPNLKWLSLDLSVGEIDDWKHYDYNEVGPVPYCMLSHLAEIQFQQFQGSASQLHLVNLFLKKTMKLEKVSFSDLLHKPPTPKTKTTIEELLSPYVQGSTRISVVFK